MCFVFLCISIYILFPNTFDEYWNFSLNPQDNFLPFKHFAHSLSLSFFPTKLPRSVCPDWEAVHCAIEEKPIQFCSPIGKLFNLMCCDGPNRNQGFVEFVSSSAVSHMCILFLLWIVLLFTQSCSIKYIYLSYDKLLWKKYKDF